MASEARPLTHLHHHFGNLDVWQQHCRLVNQRLCGVRYRRIQRRDLQARLGDEGVGQVVGCRHAIDGSQLLFQQQQTVMQVLVAVGGHGQRQFAGQLHTGEFFRRHQILIEVLKLARTLHPDIARAQRVLQFRQLAQFVVASVDPFVGKNQLGPARLDEADRRVGRHLAGVVGVHRPQHLDGIQHSLGSRCRPQLEHVQELRRVAAQRGVALADAVQEVEAFGLSEFLRLSDAGGKGVPRHSSLARPLTTTPPTWPEDAGVVNRM